MEVDEVLQEQAVNRSDQNGGKDVCLALSRDTAVRLPGRDDAGHFAAEVSKVLAQLLRPLEAQVQDHATECGPLRKQGRARPREALQSLDGRPLCAETGVEELLLLFQ